GSPLPTGRGPPVLAAGAWAPSPPPPPPPHAAAARERARMMSGRRARLEKRERCIPGDLQYPQLTRISASCPCGAEAATCGARPGHGADDNGYRLALRLDCFLTVCNTSLPR